MTNALFDNMISSKRVYQTHGPWGQSINSHEHDISLLCLISKSIGTYLGLAIFRQKRDPSIVLVKASESTLLGFNSGNNTVSGQRGMPKPNWRQWKQSAEMPTRAKRELGARPDHTWTPPSLPFNVIQPSPPVSLVIVIVFFGRSNVRGTDLQHNYDFILLLIPEEILLPTFKIVNSVSSNNLGLGQHLFL